MITVRKQIFLIHTSMTCSHLKVITNNSMEVYSSNVKFFSLKFIENRILIL